MMHRYFARTPIRGNRAVLDGPEAHHLIRVMRARAGSQVLVFDGSGVEYTAQVERLSRNEAELAILSRREVDRELPFDLVLGVAPPKGDRRRWLIEKAVELGVTRLVPLRTGRSVARPGGNTLARWERTVIEASKQCGRNRLMEIAQPHDWARFVAAAAGVPCRLLAHPGGQTAQPERPTGGSPRTPSGTSKAAVLAVGPEGGFTAEEVALATSAGWQLVDLGPRILRIETAAILLVASVVQRREAE